MDKERWEGGECTAGIRGLACIAWLGYREGVSEHAPLMYFMFARMEANGRMATVREFFFCVAISQFRDAELLASLQGMWLGALCPGGKMGRALT